MNLINFKKHYAFTLADADKPLCRSVNNRKIAFTLAEVLITLGIIGVVAAMTLPGLIQKQQDKILMESLKKFYTTFSEGLQRASIGEGCDGDMDCYFDSIGVTNNPNTKPRSELAENSIQKYISNLKPCNNTTGPEVYMYRQCLSGYKINNNFHGTGVESDSYYNFILNDGMYLAYAVTGTPNTYGWVVVDVNGPKKPNREGRDVFTFWLYKDKKILHPIDQGNCTDDNKDRQTNSCAERVMKNGWQFDY